MARSALEALPVDHAYAPGAEPTLMERIDEMLAALINNKEAALFVAAVILFFMFKRAVTSFTNVRVAQREARRRFEAEQEDAVTRELARLRAQRDSAANG